MVASPVVRPARPVRRATPERWAAAAARAAAEGVEVRQIATTGQWVATSGTDRTVCYLMDITNGVATACTCPAGDFGDPVCKHRAAYYVAAGMLDPEPPTPAAPACRICAGRGYLADPDGLRRPERCCCPAGALRPAA